jgi:hypothetical protein
MMNFISRNYLRILPLLVAGVVWAVGYVYVYKLLQYGMCTPDGYECSKLMDNFGYPYRYLAYWYLPIAIVMLIVPMTFLKRWIVFAGIFFLLTIVIISTSKNDGGGMFWGEKFYIGFFYGFLMMVITTIWLAIHLFISWRKTKKVALPTQ